MRIGPNPYHQMVFDHPTNFILVVEDSFTDRSLIRIIFESLEDSVTIQEFGHGQALLDWLVANPRVDPLFLLIDHGLPREKGLVVIGRLLQLRPAWHNRVILMSDDVDEQMREELDQLQVTRVFTKPMDFPEYESQLLDIYEAFKGEV